MARIAMTRGAMSTTGAGPARSNKATEPIRPKDSENIAMTTWMHGDRQVLPMWAIEIEADDETDAFQAAADWAYDVKADAITVVGTRMSYTADGTTILAIAYEVNYGGPTQMD